MEINGTEHWRTRSTASNASLPAGPAERLTMCSAVSAKHMISRTTGNYCLNERARGISAIAAKPVSVSVLMRFHLMIFTGRHSRYCNLPVLLAKVPGEHGIKPPL